MVVILPAEMSGDGKIEELTSEARTLLAFLVSKLPRLNPGEPRTCIGYKEAHDALGLRQKAATYGDSLKKQGLASLADWTIATGKPAITGMIVDAESLQPAAGYYRACGRCADDFQWWRDQLQRSKEYDWFPDLFPFPAAEPTPPAVDLDDVTPERVEVRVYRVLRDTQLAQRIKRAHNYECQICGHKIILSDGTRYAEAHHIRPLGRPHDGPDSADNILCLCPNHHAELDYGVRPLAQRDLKKIDGHNVGRDHIRYHNDHIAIARDLRKR